MCPFSYVAYIKISSFLHLLVFYLSKIIFLKICYVNSLCFFLLCFVWSTIALTVLCFCGTMVGSAICIRILPPSGPPTPFCPPPSCPPRLSQSAQLSFLCFIITFHWLFYTLLCMYDNLTFVTFKEDFFGLKRVPKKQYSGWFEINYIVIYWQEMIEVDNKASSV